MEGFKPQTIEEVPPVTPETSVENNTELSAEAKKNLVENITITNNEIEEIINTPDAAAKLDKDPILKEKVMRKVKLLASLIVGLGIAYLGAATLKDMGAATAGVELLKHLPIIGAGIATAMAGYMKFGPEPGPSQYSR